MEIVKMFDKYEIEEETNINILDIYWDNFCNDSAIPWWIDDEYEDENYKKINSYLLTHGAVLGEKVWIDITW